jgi:hypothetical protein
VVFRGGDNGGGGGNRLSGIGEVGVVFLDLGDEVVRKVTFCFDKRLGGMGRGAVGGGAGRAG